MAASSTSRPDTQETAAYAASQPLFDVLRGAISRLEDQKVQLTEAKETVQHIHVKVPQEHIENNGTLRADYKDALVAAWKSTAESYVRIFEQICELTGPDPAAGKQAEDSYVGFQKLLYTAEAARTVAFEQHASRKRKTDSDSESESSDSANTNTPRKKVKTSPAEIASVKRAAPPAPSPSQNNQRPAKKQRTAVVVESNNAEKPTDTPAKTATESTPINTVQRLKPKQVRKERKQRIQKHREQQEQQQAAMQPQQEESVAQVQYEDVSAEVEARMRKKEEQKKAKKEAKKRKRESGGSHILEAEPGLERDAAEARAKALAQKPAKKRSKSENGEAVRADGEMEVLPKGKRANDGDFQAAAPEEGTGARRSKRKKA